MKLRIFGLLAIAAFVVACFLGSASAQAQFFQQGPKLVGTGVITGPFGGAFQGASVALSRDGNTAIIGGDYDANTACPSVGPCQIPAVGAAWVFTRSGRVWTQQAKLVGTGAIGFARQGSSVSLSGDGNTVMLGGPSDNGSVGAAWVFTRSGRVWTQQAKLVGTGVIGPYADQGFSVSLSSAGNTAIIGGPSDDYPASNGTGIGPGAAWVFTRSGRVWTQQAKLVGTGAIGFARQGSSVSLSGDGSSGIIGGPYDDNNNNAGAAWVYIWFAGIPGQPNCHGQSVSILSNQYGSLGAAAAALGYSSVQVLQNAIAEFCAG